MATGLTISSLVNNLDGATITATLQGTPNGSVTFWSSPYPDGTQRTTCPYTSLGNSQYRVTVGNPDLYYLTVQDNTGIGTTFSPVWTLGAEEYADDIGQKLCDILYANKAALELVARRIYPACTISEVLYGYAPQGDLFPVITVAEPEADEEFYSAPFGTLTTLRFVISVGVAHNTDIPQLQLVTKLGSAIQRLLNLPRYNTIRTSPTAQITEAAPLSFYGCHCDSLRSNEQELPDGRFGALAQLNWSGQLQLTQVPNGALLPD